MTQRHVVPLELTGQLRTVARVVILRHRYV
jgi:hypothetical protein